MQIPVSTVTYPPPAREGDWMKITYGPPHSPIQEWDVITMSMNAIRLTDIKKPAHSIYFVVLLEDLLSDLCCTQG